ncbi:MAG: molecular chaperone HtpG [Proteobacteria bacterium]|nr:molecular chaperone HtpG [Pseudomonadota bacterium]
MGLGGLTVTTVETVETGNISIHAENILPIIKRWLYSEKEIFIRELVANAADATTKLSKLAIMGDVKRDIEEPKITVTINKDTKTLTISDNGLGMTSDEVKKYINQVAFSGVKDFVAKYQDKGDEQQIIGHFGLGFYSSYMVASKVELDTLSYQEGATAAHWSCDGSTEFSMGPGTRSKVGTDIILHIADDSSEMLDQYKIRELLQRYCAFIKVPIELAGEIVNDPNPIWTKAPSTLTDKDYKDFFNRVFPYQPEPLFWIHLNVEHPFNLKGILFFPKIRHELEASQGQVKLFCNQVFVADNCKELIPEFLTLLKGVVDCPDLPLNVSRSYLQNDPTVQKISEHIIKKVADKLTGMAKTELDTYKKYWDDIQPFVKFGMLKDSKFYDRMVDHLLFKCASGEYQNLDQYLEKNKDKSNGKVIYASDANAQAPMISMLKAEEIDVIMAETFIDSHFLPYVEMQSGRKYSFQRVDSDIASHLKDTTTVDMVDPTDNKKVSEKIDELFRKFLTKANVKVKVESLKSNAVPSMLTIDENMRRMKEMSKHSPFGAQDNPWEAEHTLVINQNNPAIKNLVGLAKTFNKDEDVKMVVDHIYDLAWLQQGKFDAEMMKGFIDRSSKIIERLGSQA